MASQTLWFPFFLWRFSKLQLTLSPSHALLYMCIFQTELGALQSRSQQAKEKRKQMLASNIKKPKSSVCTAWLPAMHWPSLMPCSPGEGGCSLTLCLPPSLHEGVSSNVKQSNCSVLLDLVMHQTGLTGSWENFNCDLVTLGIFSPVFGAIKQQQQLSAFSLCLSKAMKKIVHHKQANMPYILEISLRLLDAELIYQVNRKWCSAVDQFTFMNPGPNSAVHIPFKSSLRQESQRLLDTPLYSYII